MELRHAAARAARYGYRFCLVMVQIDALPAFREMFGGREGDQLAREVAALLAGGLRAGDGLYSCGDGRFLALLPQQSRVGGARVATRAIEGVAGLRIPRGWAIDEVVTASAGLALLGGPEGYAEQGAALEGAQEELEQAIAAGGGRLGRPADMSVSFN